MKRIPKNAIKKVRAFSKEIDWIDRIPSKTPPRILLIVFTKLTVDCLNPIASARWSCPIILMKIGVSMAPEK